MVLFGQRTQRRTPPDAARTAGRVAGVTIAGNLLLTVFKLAAAIGGHSSAMLSDAVHSASDVFSSVIVIVGVRMSVRAPDRDHPYGHERLECVAALLLAGTLCAAGLVIGRSALAALLAGDAAAVASPGRVALAAAAVSILCKEGMYWYARHYARLLGSDALMADAWHHRSDALSSVGALVGIAGARHGAPLLEPLASLLICLFILQAAYTIFRDAVSKLVDRACSEETEQAMRRCAAAQPGVEGVDVLHTRVFGNKAYVDMEIGMCGDLTLWQAHAAAEQVHAAIEEQFPQVKHIMVHVNPRPSAAPPAGEADGPAAG